jgi:hypothetical protein
MSVLSNHLPPPESNAWWPRLRAVFRQGYTDTLVEVRGVGSGMDTDPELTVGYAYAEQRGSPSGNMYTQGRRGEMNPIPTPQELIRRVTGVGDPVRGR